MRDSQRQRVYDAESVLSGLDVVFPSLAETQEFVDQVTRTTWWKKRSILHHVIVGDGRRRRSAAAYGHSIRMPRWSRSKGIILHELAHLMTRTGPPHGPSYAANFLALVGRFMGPEDAAKLRASFKAHRVRYRGAAKPRYEVIRPVCKHCGKPISGTAWKVSAVAGPFCTKRDLQEWINQRTIKDRDL